ncbi:MAG: hypothetical protein RLZZ361_1148 [Cyanobacteriota bacterium]|jgi:hypothetical protein
MSKKKNSDSEIVIEFLNNETVNIVKNDAPVIVKQTLLEGVKEIRSGSNKIIFKK